MNLFERNLIKGEVGERMALIYLINKGWNVQDVTKNENYFSKDIDFLAAKDGVFTTIDVKTEEKMTETGNMFVEAGVTYSNGKYKTGWLYYSKAEYIWHINPDNGMAFAYKLEEMKEYLEMAPQRWGVCKDRNKTVDGRLVKPEEYKNSGYWWQEMNLREFF